MRRKLSHPSVFAALALVLLGLAALQYRWVGEIAAAERERLERGLESSARFFRDDFNRELRRLAETFWLDPRESEAVQDRIARSARAWTAAPEPRIPIESVYLLQVDSRDGVTTQVLDPDTLHYQSAELPADIELWARSRDRDGRRRTGPPGLGRPGSWSVITQANALSTTLIRIDDFEPGRRFRPEPLGVLYLILDVERLRNDLLPRLEARYFGAAGEGGGVRIVPAGPPGPPLYESDPGAELPATVRMPLLWTREEAAREVADRVRGRFADRFGGATPPNGPPPRGRPRRDPGGSFLDPALPFATALAPGPGPGWLLEVGYAGGSLDALVARTRRRNLAVSFGILLLLGAGMALVLTSARRAQRLAEMQMEFVAGVSHELRTPLAVIRSAGENLAEGVVSSPDQVREYGSLVRDEGRRLSELVEDSLGFAAAQSGRRRSDVRTHETAALLRESLEEVRGGVEIETSIPNDLPPVKVDAGSLRLCLRNLIQNAVKYGGGSGWVGVKAAAAPDAVTVAVSDRGPGIPTDDLAHVFEPFYRGRHAADHHVRGVGLGLSLSKDAAESFGGSLSVESAAGVGTTFTIRLPRAENES